MLNTFEKEIYLHGNLELYFSLKQIKKLNLEELKNLKQIYSKGWCWRFYKNFKSILSTREFDIINNHSSFIIFLDLLKSVIVDCEKINKIKNKYLDPENINNYLIVIYCILKDIKFKLDSYSTNCNTENIKKVFNKYFSLYIPYLNNQDLILDYVSPFEGNNWTSSWKFIYDNKEYKLKNIDIYIDTYFYNQNIYYNHSMNENIPALINRLQYLKSNTTMYYKNIINTNLNSLTTKIFNIFPLNMIYTQYKQLLDIDDEIYCPELFKLSTKTENDWFFSIIPNYLTGYILGFPIINCDIPSNKNIKEYIKKFGLLGKKEYYKEISIQVNKKKIELTTFGIPCGNSLEEEEISDLTLTKVIEYNMDDIMIFFNTGVFHVFTPPEFPNLVKKETNPYNRSPIPVYNNILENMRFRKKVTRYLNNRGVKVKLNNTMEENYNLLLYELNNPSEEEIDNEDIGNGMEIFNSSFINFLINSYNV